MKPVATNLRHQLYYVASYDAFRCAACGLEWWPSDVKEVMANSICAPRVEAVDPQWPPAWVGWGATA